MSLLPVDDSPGQFEYDGQLYVVREVLTSSIAKDPLGHVDEWVVVAIPVDPAAARMFDLTRNNENGTWSVEPAPEEKE